MTKQSQESAENQINHSKKPTKQKNQPKQQQQNLPLNYFSLLIFFICLEKGTKEWTNA